MVERAKINEFVYGYVGATSIAIKMATEVTRVNSV